MATHSRPLGGNLGKVLGVILALALLAPALTAKGRRGNDVLVTKKDGTTVQGELLAVKGTDLLIMEGGTAAGVTVGLADVRTVRVIKESRLLKGMGAGFLVGGLVGAGIGALAYTESPGGWDMFDNRGQSAFAGAMFFGVIGVVIGGVAGGIAGTDADIPVSAAVPSGLTSAAERLRKYARDRS